MSIQFKGQESLPGSTNRSGEPVVTRRELLFRTAAALAGGGLVSYLGFRHLDRRDTNFKLKLIRLALQLGIPPDHQDLKLDEDSRRKVSDLLVRNLRKGSGPNTDLMRWLDEACILRAINRNCYEQLFSTNQSRVVQTVLQASTACFAKVANDLHREASFAPEREKHNGGEKGQPSCDIIDQIEKLRREYDVLAGEPEFLLLHNSLIALTDEQRQEAIALLNGTDSNLRKSCSDGLRIRNSRHAAYFTQSLAAESKETAKVLAAKESAVIDQLQSRLKQDRDWKILPGSVRYLPGESGEIWELSLYPLNGGCIAVLRDATTPNRMVSLEVEDFLDYLGRDQVPVLQDRARKTYTEEQKTDKLLRQFDFPEDAAISYLRFFPLSRDLVISSNIFPSIIFANALQSRYEDQVHVQPMVFSDSILESLRSGIATAAAEKNPHIYLDLFHHGEKKGGLGFSDTSDINELARSLVKLAADHPQAHFYYGSIACYGGGLLEALQKNLEKAPASVRGRISLFLQAKSDLVNVSHLLTGVGFIYLLSDSLSSSKTIKFGEAYAQAAKALKESYFSDPNGIIHGQPFAGLPVPVFGQFT